MLAGGFGSAVREGLAKEGLYPPILALGVPDTLVPHGSRAQLLAKIGLTPEGIAERTLAWLSTTEPALP